MKDYVGLDFETYGDVNLPEEGLYRYVSSPHFRPLIAAVAQMDGILIEQRVYDFTRPEKPATASRLRAQPTRDWK